MLDKYIALVVLYSLGIAIVLKATNYNLTSRVLDYYRQIADVLLFVFIARVNLRLAKKWHFGRRIKPTNRAVFITGCDSGFGHEIAKRLDSVGFTVFASCLFPSGEGANALKTNCSCNLHILELDVTEDESVKRSVEYVKKHLGNCELWAIVNNAGIAKGTAVELSSMSDFKDTMEVNTFGTIRVTKAFLPLLRRSRGRVVNVASILGRLFIPNGTPYTISKAAVVAFTECFKQEMDSWGIRVISIEPEFFRTAITNSDNLLKRFEESLQNISNDVKDVYDGNYISKFKRFIGILDIIGSKNISIVIDDLQSAISLENPDSVYKPCRNIVTQTILFLSDYVPKYVVEMSVKLILFSSTVSPRVSRQNIPDTKYEAPLIKNIFYSSLLKILYLLGLCNN